MRAQAGPRNQASSMNAQTRLERGHEATLSGPEGKTMPAHVARENGGMKQKHLPVTSSMQSAERHNPVYEGPARGTHNVIYILVTLSSPACLRAEWSHTPYRKSP